MSRWPPREPTVLDKPPPPASLPGGMGRGGLASGLGAGVASLWEPAPPSRGAPPTAPSVPALPPTPGGEELQKGETLTTDRRLRLLVIYGKKKKKEEKPK